MDSIGARYHRISAISSPAVLERRLPLRERFRIRLAFVFPAEKVYFGAAFAPKYTFSAVSSPFPVVGEGGQGGWGAILKHFPSGRGTALNYSGR